jgi:sodium pump decarboxylase gamma subunit
MNSLLVLSLQITALGMGIVFTAIILLSVMMSLLTRFTEQREDISEPGTGASDSPESAPDLDREFKAQAAAVAVALALAEQKISQPIHEPPTTLVSAWQLGMRTRQLYQKGMSLRRGARKAG